MDALTADRTGGGVRAGDASRAAAPAGRRAGVAVDPQGNVVTEYGTETGEYEEVFSIDHCFGDHVPQPLLDGTRAVRRPEWQ